MPMFSSRTSGRKLSKTAGKMEMVVENGTIRKK